MTPSRKNIKISISLIIAIGQVFLLFFLVADQAAAARDVGEKRECATCHIMWLRDFKRNDVKTLIPYNPKPVEPTGKQDIASTERMCFSCHDGYVLDSRKTWQKGSHGHRVGMKPSSKIKIPTSKNKVIFPLNDDGKVYCGTCHSAHGVDWKDKQSPSFLRARNVQSSLCLACHLDKSTGPAEGNHPIFKKLNIPLPDTLKYKGAKVGRKNSVICETCHEAHGAETRTYQLVMKSEKDSLCASCHQDKKEVDGTKHDLRTARPKAVNKKGKTAKESGVCSACHTPHGGRGPALWARERVEGVEASAAGCLGCHNKNGLAKKKVLKKHSHPVGVNIAEVGIDVKKGKWTHASSKTDPSLQSIPLPLYDKHGNQAEHGGSVGCGSCHDPHGSSAEKLINITSRLDNPQEEPVSSFLRLPNHKNSDLCLNCHHDKKTIALSKHNPAIFSPEKASKDDSKNKGGLCEACHNVHNSEQSPLWARKSGQGDTAGERLCNDCHKKGGIAERKLTGKHGHPMGVKPLTTTSTGLPLYAKGETTKGKHMDCATCHNLHQWDPNDANNTSGATLEVEGDSSNSYLRKTAVSGELCNTCHQKKNLVVNTEHDLNVTAADTVNKQGKTVKQSGVCGQCHSIHQDDDLPYLWAQTVDKKLSMPDALCKSCHADKKMAKNKQPRKWLHPENIKVWSQKVRNRFGRRTESALSVSDSKGEADLMGIITCLTCHDPHQWKASKDKKGPGRNIEGDVTNSFLRAKNTSDIVCADCHGREALFRYKYFHGLTSHKKYWLSK